MDNEPSAVGAISAVNVPRVPAGGVPKRVAVPFPLSVRDNHEGADPRLHETGVCAPTEVKTIEFGAFVMNVASDGGPMLAAGAGAMLTPKPWTTVPCELDATTPQPALPLIRIQTWVPDFCGVPLMVPEPLPLSVNVNPNGLSNAGSTDRLIGGSPVVVTWKLTGKPAVPPSVEGEVTIRCWLTSIV
jgi:hypothetical protein